jgi:hypothetical protein
MDKLKSELIQGMVDDVKTRLRHDQDTYAVLAIVTTLNERFEHAQLTEMLAYSLVKIAELQLYLESSEP